MTAKGERSPGSGRTAQHGPKQAVSVSMDRPMIDAVEAAAVRFTGGNVSLLLRVAISDALARWATQPPPPGLIAAQSGRETEDGKETI